MELDVPIDLDFDCPVGQHSASFYDYKEVTKPIRRGHEKFVRLRFKIDSLSTEEKIVLVCKNFVPSLKQDSELRNTLDAWLGEEFIRENTKARKFNFDSLNGLKANVVVRHIENGMAKPYVCLDGVYPASRLAEFDI